MALAVVIASAMAGFVRSRKIEEHGSCLRDMGTSTNRCISGLLTQLVVRANWIKMVRSASSSVRRRCVRFGLSLAAREELVVRKTHVAQTGQQPHSRQHMAVPLYGCGLLPEACNMKVSDNKLLAGAMRQLESRLPPGWAIESLMGRGPVDAQLTFTSSEGRSRSVPVALKCRIDPRMANQVPSSLIVVAPYLSKSVREVLEARGASYADHTGNTRLVLDEPGLFILTTGADSNPWPDKRRLSLRGIKAGRVVRALALRHPPVGVRELAERADTDPGYVSRLLQMLDSEAIVERTARGRVERVDWRRLLVQ